LINNTVKINCTIPDSYRELVRYLKEIAAELTQLGHRVRNIINVKHRTTKEPLNTFFVDVESAANNKEVYNSETLQNVRIKIEPPHRPMHEMPTIWSLEVLLQ
jgi:hypothetical protein